jgi:hypothetical protein
LVVVRLAGVGLKAHEGDILETVVNHPRPTEPEADAIRRRLQTLMAEGVLSYARTRPSLDSTSCLVCGAQFVVGEDVHEAGVGGDPSGLILLAPRALADVASTRGRLDFVGSWVSADVGRFFQLMERDDMSLLQRVGGRLVAPDRVRDRAGRGRH